MKHSKQERVQVRTTEALGRTAALVWLAAGFACAATSPFTVVTLPDTQKYSKSYPQNFDNQTAWIVSQRQALNVVFVTHLGDITDNHDDLVQWNRADVSMRVLDIAGIPYGCCPGNHDFHYGNGSSSSSYDPSHFDASGTNYRAFFGPQRFAGTSWYRGCSPSELSNYQIAEYAPGQSILFLHLCVETPPAELAWAQGVLNAHRDLPVWVTTHRYMQNAEQYAGSIGAPLGVLAGRFPQVWYDVAEQLYMPGGTTSEAFFQLFVRTNKNIFMVHCGHFHGWFKQTSANNWGLPVQEILTDYQDAPNGGDGWLRYYTFNEQADGSFRVDARTYSTTQGVFGDPGAPFGDYPSQFSFTVRLSDYVYRPNQLALSLRQGTAGYTGVTDTSIKAANAGSSYGASTILDADDDTENGLDFGDEPAAQALLRFDNLFAAPVREGDALPTRIPTDAAVDRATLTFYILDDVDADVVGNMPDDAFRIFRLNTGFSNNSTWNSVGGGMYGSRVGPQIAVFNPDNVPDGNEVRSEDVTSAVTAWKNGSPNHGFLLTTWPRNLSWFDDGVEIASSEHGDSLKRPSLAVDATYSVANIAPTVTLSLNATATTVDEGTVLQMSLGASDPNPADPLVFKINSVPYATLTGSGSRTFDVSFPDNGSFVCAATIHDDETAVAAGNVTVTVRNVPPRFARVPADTLLPDTAPLFTYRAEAVDPGAADILTFAWDFDNNGTWETLGADVSNRFAGTGVFPVGLRVSDDDGGTCATQFIVRVEAEASVAYHDAFTLNEDQVLNAAAPGCLANDRRRLGAVPQVVTPPVYGTLVLNADGSFTYAPAPNWNGDDTFAYVLAEGAAVTAPATVALHVGAVPDAPAGLSEVYFAAANGLFEVGAPGVLANDSDPDGDGLQAWLMRGPDSGDVTLDPDGGFLYLPYLGFKGTDTFDYLLRDDSGRSGGLLTVTLHVFNPAPVPAQPLTNLTTAATVSFGHALPAAAFTDDFDGDTLVWSVTRADGSELPSWLTFAPATRTLAGTPAVRDAGVLDLQAVVTDSDGATAAQYFSLTVLAPVVRTAYEQWADESLSAWAGSERGFEADADGDGLANGFPFTFGGALTTQALMTVRWDSAGPWLATPVAVGGRTNDVDIRVRAAHALGAGASWDVPVVGPSLSNGLWQWRLQDPATQAFFRLQLQLKAVEGAAASH